LHGARFRIRVSSKPGIKVGLCNPANIHNIITIVLIDQCLEKTLIREPIPQLWFNKLNRILRARTGFDVLALGLEPGAWSPG